MEITIFYRKTHYKLPFSIAMLNYQWLPGCWLNLPLFTLCVVHHHAQTATVVQPFVAATAQFPGHQGADQRASQGPW